MYYEQSLNCQNTGLEEHTSNYVSSSIGIRSASPLNYQDLLNYEESTEHNSYMEKPILFESQEQYFMNPDDTELILSKLPLKERKDQSDNAVAIYHSFTEHGLGETANMAQPAAESVACATEKTGCNLTIQNFMEESSRATEVLTQLGHMVDPNNLKPSLTWKGFAKDKLKYDNSKIIATAYHTKGNPNNGHFMSLLEDMVALGITIGDIVEYYAREETKRHDVLSLLFKHHSSCPYCDKYRRFDKTI
ncbi:hypothetical protein FSP39_016678 [Pinctada imbricata]|uniref:Uncharacterized protein n=1 Tax=Pinctada imbricata TaxID=66713 RepID=A0AA88YEN9_PINIB|nr:hypothetical protein FSP39_016678 [Pinctada imbricata]